MIQPVPDGDRDTLLACLPPDPSESPETAWDITADGSPVEGDLICPKYDEDYWKVNVVGDRQLMQIEALFLSPGSVSLTLDWMGPKRLCMDASPTACTTSDDCTGQLCDDMRGGCREPNASLCFDAAHCPGEACTLGQPDTIVGSIGEIGSVVNRHEVRTIVPAFIPGDYYIKIWDDAGVAEDDDNTYELTLTQFEDPDVNEPNNSPNMATPLVSGTPANGTFSYRGDVDVYQITPPTGATAVMLVDFTYPAGSEVVPTWSATQLDTDSGDVLTFLPTEDAHTGPGGWVSSSALVMSSDEPIVITVTNPGGAVDPDAEYTLDVTVFQDDDPGETPNRDDSVLNASDVTLGSSATQRIVADNDVDWYHLVGGSSNSVAEISVVANASPPVSAPFLLKFQVYYLMPGRDCGTCGICSPYTDQGACDNATNCAWVNGGCAPCGFETSGACNGAPGCTWQTDRCVVDLPSPYGEQKACIAALDNCADVFQRPQIFTPRSWDDDWGDEYGGPVPETDGSCPGTSFCRNNLTARVPVYGNREMYVLVQHINSTPLAGYVGYDDTVTYTLSTSVVSEDDNPGDAGPNYSAADNYFIPEPLAGEYDAGNPPRWHGVDYGSFHRHDRSVGSGGGWTCERVASGGSCSGSGGVSNPYAILTTRSFLGEDGGGAPYDATECTQLAFDLFDAAGETTGSITNVTLTTTVGALFTDAACTTPVPDNVFNLPGEAPYFLMTAATLTSGTIATSVSGNAIPFEIEVYPAGSSSSPRLTFDTEDSPRETELGGRSRAILVSAPDLAANLEVSIGDGGGSGFLVICNANQDGDDCREPLATGNCSYDGSAPACPIVIPSDGDDDDDVRGFYVEPTGTAAGYLVITVSATGYLGDTWVIATNDPPIWTYAPTSGNEITGELSYQGDNDFFIMPLPASLGPGTMTATLYYSGGAANPRASIARVSGDGWPSGAAGISVITGADRGGDVNCSGSGCTVGTDERCYYVTAGGEDFRIWVNDYRHDQPSAGSSPVTYRVEFTYQEGCAAYCHEYACQ